MRSKAGSALGLAGGMVAVAGLWLPWASVRLDFRALWDVLGATAGTAEEALRAALPTSSSGLDFLWHLTLNPLDPGVVGGNGSDAQLLRLWGVAAALILALAAVIAASFALDLSKRDGHVARALGWLRSARVWFGVATVVLPGRLIAGFGRTLAILLSVYGTFLTSREWQEASGLDPGIASRTASLLDQIVHASPGVGLYLCAAGGAIAVAGGLIGRRLRGSEPGS